MKIVRLFFAISGIMISCLVHGSQFNKQQLKTTQKELSKINRNLNRDPKLAYATPISQSIKTANTQIEGVLLNATYSNTAQNPVYAIADFKKAQELTQKSQEAGAPLPVSIFYNMPHAQKEAAEKIYNGLIASHDKNTLSVSAQTWRQIGSDMPLAVRLSLSHVTVKLEKSPEQQIEHLAAHTLKGAIVGGTSAAIISLGKDSSENALEATKNKLWENKASIAAQAAKKSFEVITQSGTKAIDSGLEYANTQINATDYNQVGMHCHPELFPENTFFTDVANQAGRTLKDDFIAAGIDLGIDLAKEFAPGAILNVNNLSVNPAAICCGITLGGGMGLLNGVRTMDNYIQQAPIGDIYCRRA